MKSINITPALIELIKTARTKKGLSGVKLSKALGKKSNNFIALVEGHRIDKIKYDDLKKLLQILFDLDDDQVDHHINSLIAETERDQETPIIFYNKKDQSRTLENFKKMRDFITEGFDIAYKENPRYAFESVGELSKNMNFDLGFMLAFISIPFYLLEKTEPEIRQELYDDINVVFEKYIKEYGSKKESSEEN